MQEKQVLQEAEKNLANIGQDLILYELLSIVALVYYENCKTKTMGQGLLSVIPMQIQRLLLEPDSSLWIYTCANRVGKWLRGTGQPLNCLIVNLW